MLKGKLAVMESKYDENAIDLIAPLMELARAEFDQRNLINHWGTLRASVASLVNRTTPFIEPPRITRSPPFCSAAAGATTHVPTSKQHTATM